MTTSRGLLCVPAAGGPTGAAPRCRPNLGRRWPGFTRLVSAIGRRRHRDPALAACALWEATIDEIGEPLPAVEAGLRLVALNPLPPRRARECLVHGDFRLEPAWRR